MADRLSLPKVLIVTGTGTELGKTMTTAAVAVVLRRRGVSVAVVKPVQTGLTQGDRGDVGEVRARLGEDPASSTYEFVRLRDPLAPESAARNAGLDLPPVLAHVERIEQIAADVDHVLVEGAGGLLVRLDSHGASLADLGSALQDRGISTAFVVVVAAGLGTLNHTALTAEALAARGLRLLGVILGSWPADPDLAARSNLHDLPLVAGAPLLGRLPAGIGSLSPAQFRKQAPVWLDFA